MKTTRQVCFAILYGFLLSAASAVQADTLSYTLDNVILDDGTQMTGTFSWTYAAGDFENGAGQFTELDIPWTTHNQDDLDAAFDIGGSIEITLEGSVHDDGVDITLFLEQSLTPTTGTPIDLVRSKYEIGGNGFHDGVFLGGTILPVVVLGAGPGSEPVLRLLVNTPNPFRSSTLIRYELNQSDHVDVRVFDSSGRMVRVLEQALKQPGQHEVRWDGNDASGAATVAGIYFYRVQAGDFMETRKAMRLR